MDIARQVTVSAPARRRPSALSMVTPQRGRGAMPTSEELIGLMAAVAGGDRQAFAVLFKHFAPRIKAYLMRGGTSAASAEELAQEAMALLWRKAATFEPARAGVSTWIFTVARNLRIDRHRRQGGNDAESVDAAALESTAEPADPGAEPGESLDARRRERRVQAALRQLSPEQARVIQLSYFAEQAHAAIAAELRIPLGTVKSRMRLAVEHLRRLIDADDAP